MEGPMKYWESITQSWYATFQKKRFLDSVAVSTSRLSRTVTKMVIVIVTGVSASKN
jgi:hypothetical protein